MRNKTYIAAMATALMTSSVVSAAPVTYVISGIFTGGSNSGTDAGLAVAAAMGTPTTFSFNFTIDSDNPGDQHSPNYARFDLFDVPVSIDGITTVTQSRANVVATNTYFELGLSSTDSDDRVPELDGPEGVSFIVRINFLQTTGNAYLPSVMNVANFGATSVDYYVSNGWDENGMSYAVRSASGPFGSAVTGLSVTGIPAPAPEPGEWAMMAAGLGIVGGVAKRRRRG